MLSCACSQAESVRVLNMPRQTRPQPDSLVPIDSDPYIGETPQESLQAWLTPNKMFYVRNHFSTPQTDDSTGKLHIEGHVSRPLTLDIADIFELPKRTMPVTIECAGNNRSDLDPSVPGNPFQNGAISNAMWAGAALRDVLDMVDIEDGAVEVLFEGFDSGKPEPDVEVIPYLRSMPVDVALHPDTLLAYEMNGEPLPVEHGYPLRLIVPGWYGMASVKWLSRIEILDHAFEGFFQTDRYIIEQDDGPAIPLSSIYVKSLISNPQQGDVLRSGTVAVAGVAWSGSAYIKKVEVSDDGGNTWILAELVGPCERYTWQQWQFSWTPASPGHYTLVARAEDEAGNIQPLETKWNRLGYAINGVKPICVTIQDVV